MIPGSGSDVNTTLPLALSIAAAVLCCNPILGLPAIVLAVQARNAASVGSINLARKRARAAFVLSLAAMGSGLSFELFEAVRYLAAAH